MTRSMPKSDHSTNEAPRASSKAKFVAKSAARSSLLTRLASESGAGEESELCELHRHSALMNPVTLASSMATREILTTEANHFGPPCISAFSCGWSHWQWTHPMVLYDCGIAIC